MRFVNVNVSLLWLWLWLCVCMCMRDFREWIKINRYSHPSIHPKKRFSYAFQAWHMPLISLHFSRSILLLRHTHTHILFVSIVYSIISADFGIDVICLRDWGAHFYSFSVFEAISISSPPPLSLSRSPLSLSLILSHTYTLSLSLSTHLKKKQGTTALTYDDACRLGHSFSSTITPFLDRFLFKSPQMYYNNLLKSLVIQSS